MKKLLMLLMILFAVGCSKVSEENPVNGNNGDLVEKELDSEKSKEISQENAQELNTLFVDMVEAFESQGTTDMLEFSQQMLTLKEGFREALRNNPENLEAQVGFSIASMVGLGASEKMAEFVDSLDAFIGGDDYVSGGNGFLAKKFESEGTIGLTKALVSQTPVLVKRQVEEYESFPDVFTFSYIQQMAEEEIIPILDEILAYTALFDHENVEPVFLQIDEFETLKIDAGEFYLFEAFTSLLRAYILTFCTYNLDMVHHERGDNSWYNYLLSGSGYSSELYLSGDTLVIEDSWGNAENDSLMFEVLKYNYENTDFLTLRSDNSSKIKSDYLRIPVSLRKAVNYITTSTNMDSDNIIKLTDINNINEEFALMRDEMIDEGISQSFASNFESIDSFLDLVTTLLSGEFRINEEIDGTTFDITVNLTANLDNPITDMRDMLPKFVFLPKNEWVTVDEYYSNVSPASDNTFSLYNSLEDYNVMFDNSLIENVDNSGWQTAVTLSYDFNYIKTREVDYLVNPIALVDDSGNRIDYDEFPYFDDYTFNGVFPRLDTREKWIELIESIH